MDPSVSQDSLPGASRLRLVAPLVARDPDAEHRPATPLELFFDLVSVVAVAFAADSLHHALVRGEIAPALGRYVVVFFGL